MHVVYIMLIILSCLSILSIVYLVISEKLTRPVLRLNEVKTAIKQILKEKHSLLKRANTICQTNLKLEDTLFHDINNLIINKVDDIDLDKRLTSGVELIVKIKNDHTSLDNNKGLDDLLNEMKLIDEKLEASKSYYNHYAKSLNTMISKYPNKIVSKIKKITSHPYFDSQKIVDSISL